jgi:3-hydroxyisobutyrate dehydrogenase-like beta-hydroxyacid dehydrogenase
MAPVGLIGLGLMGRAMGERWMKSGGKVLGYDRDPSAMGRFQEIGGVVGADAASVFAVCEVVLLSLPSDREVRQVLLEADPAIRPGQLVVDTTTGDPESTRAVAAELAARGVDHVDATISGSSEQTRQGQTLWMAGGEQAAFDRCRDLFRILSRQTIHTGPSGTGATMKLVTNLVLGLNRAALAEGLAFADAIGLELERTLEVLRSSMAYSRIMDSKGERMVCGEFQPPQARLSQHLKDVRLILNSSSRAGQPLPLSEAHRLLLELGETLGLGDLDNSAILRAIASLRRPGGSA